MSVEIDIDLLRQVLRYEPETGLLFWRKRPASMFQGTDTRSPEWLAKWWNSRFAEKSTPDQPNSQGYRDFTYMRHTLKAHRVIWAMYYGRWPSGQIDHIDGDTLNNRIENLRDVSPSENSRNKRTYKSNRSGYPGVFLVRRSGRWAAYVGGSGGRRSIGTFCRKEDAIVARQAAEQDHGYHPNHGRRA